MEEYIWKSKLRDGLIYTYVLTIGEEYDRYNGEGILQNVKIKIISDSSEDELYETLFGREKAIKDWSVLNNPISIPLEDEQITEFKNWLITCLTPKTEQRKIKIGRIKNKIPYTIK
jgi:hypothetical protein